MKTKNQSSQFARVYFLLKRFVHSILYHIWMFWRGWICEWIIATTNALTIPIYNKENIACEDATENAVYMLCSHRTLSIICFRNTIFGMRWECYDIPKFIQVERSQAKWLAFHSTKCNILTIFDGTCTRFKMTFPICILHRMLVNFHILGERMAHLEN